MTASQTLRSLAGLPTAPAPLRDSALVMIDFQNTYTTGVMQLENAGAALEAASRLLARARAEGAPVIHIQHDDGPGSLYDVAAEIGRIAAPVAPAPGETIITKTYPSSFEKTTLDEELKRLGVQNVVYAGFMTHMCVNSTARVGFNLGYAGTVVAAATATRSLPDPQGGVVPAAEVHRAALAALGDLFAIVVKDQSAIT